jgi:uncharacterized membrane protein
MLTTLEPDAPRRGGLRQQVDLDAAAPKTFEVLCQVEKWPVWLSFLRSVRLIGEAALGPGSEIGVRSSIPGEEEELYEVDRYVDGHALSLVGFYSIRRRFEFRVETRSAHSRLVASVHYPSYGGAIGALLDRFTARRRLGEALTESLMHFKGLVEYKPSDEALTDF